MSPETWTALGTWVIAALTGVISWYARMAVVNEVPRLREAVESALTERLTGGEYGVPVTDATGEQGIVPLAKHDDGSGAASGAGRTDEHRSSP